MCKGERITQGQMEPIKQSLEMRNVSIAMFLSGKTKLSDTCSTLHLSLLTFCGKQKPSIFFPIKQAPLLR